MKNAQSIKSYEILVSKFFSRDISDFEAYHWLRIHKSAPEIAERLINKWTNDRKTLEAEFGKGK